MAKKHYFWPITIIFVYIWDELGATNCNLYAPSSMSGEHSVLESGFEVLKT